MIDTADKNSFNFDPNEIEFEYLDGREAIYLMGLLKGHECTNCPDFSVGCSGDYPIAHLANMPVKEYLFKHKKGTENYICGKIRNIIGADQAKLNAINISFSKAIKEKVGFLEFDNDKIVVNSTHVWEQVYGLEQEFNQKIQEIVKKYNSHVIQLQKQLSSLNNQIKDYQEQINMAKNTINKQSYELKKMENAVGRPKAENKQDITKTTS